MSDRFPTPSQNEVWTAVEHINESWLSGYAENLGRYLHDEFVMVLPGFSGEVHGKPAAVASYEEFTKSSTIRHYEETEPRVDVIGGTAIASYAFDIRWEREGRGYRGTGRDLFVFQHQDGKWLAVWRTMLEMSEQEID